MQNGDKGARIIERGKGEAKKMIDVGLNSPKAKVGLQCWQTENGLLSATLSWAEAVCRIIGGSGFATKRREVEVVTGAVMATPARRRDFGQGEVRRRESQRWD